jgi:hypothetical protein
VDEEGVALVRAWIEELGRAERLSTHERENP